MVYDSSHRQSISSNVITAMSLLGAVATAVTIAAHYYQPEVLDLVKKKLQVAIALQPKSKEEGADDGITSTTKSRKSRHQSKARSKTQSTLPQQQQQQQQQQQHALLPPGAMIVRPIGIVKSIYRLCVGTPRQGLLAPNARGRIELTGNVDVVDGLDQFSHIWIVFHFHLNTTSSSSSSSGGRSSNNNKPKKQPSKIAPPALGGKKVGVLATRSPHRGNPIGMTLCQLDSIEVMSNKSKHKNAPTVILHISGLDLVDGTPVLDIKPFVPHYDSVPTDDGVAAPLQVPSWVSGGLATKRQVVISQPAIHELYDLLEATPDALDFYGPHCGDASIEDTVNSILPCIQQVLAVDVRSKWQTKKARGGKSQADRAERVQDVMTKGSTNSSSLTAVVATDTAEATNDDTATAPLCTQQLDNLLIYYSLDKPEETNRDTSEGSGAEDVVTVHSLQLLATSKGGRRRNSSNHSTQCSRAPRMPPPSAECDDNHEFVPGPMKQSRPYFLGSGQKITQFEKKPSNYIAPPLEKGGYTVIQQYWNEVGTTNTPKGIIPAKVAMPERNNKSVPRELHRSLPSQEFLAPRSPTWPSQESPPTTPTQQGRSRQELEDLVDDKPFLDALENDKEDITERTDDGGEC